MAIRRTTRWALAAVAVAVAAVAVAAPAAASSDNACVVETKRCCWHPYVCGVVKKTYVKFVKHECLKKLVKPVRVPCHYGGGGRSYRLAEVPDHADAADASSAVSDTAAPADATTGTTDEAVSLPVMDAVARRAYTYRDPEHKRKWCWKKRVIAYKSTCDKKVVRVKYFPKICYKKKCTVVVHGHGRGKRSYVDYNRGVDDDKVGGGGAKGYFHRTLGY